MPTIVKGNQVLVSGANGYLAMWITRILLERGYLVRGTVRTVDKGEFMNKYFTSLGYGDQFEFVVVEDIAKEGAFDEAVKDMDAIVHAASPFHANAKNAEDFFRPAIQGTVGILHSVLKNGHKVKRTVVTSSCAAVMSPLSKPTMFSESDWNTDAAKEVEAKGANAPPMSIYRASKTLAEKSTWSFYENHKAEINWDLTVINPPGIFGPHIQDVSSPEALNASSKMWWNVVVDNTPKSKELLMDSTAWVDVRDCALGHVLALEKREAGGERIITCSGPFIWQEWIDVANSLTPNPLPSHKFPKGFPELVEGNRVYKISYDTEKEKRLLGIKYRTQAETTRDILEDFARRGW